MSGHSHWAGIKHKKAAMDAKKGKVFGKLAKIISVAAREKGGDPSMNPRLRIAIETAQKANMPKDNIERAIKKGTGELEGAQFEEIIIEIYGPEGVAILVEAITDNKNRTISEIKGILSRHNGKMASEGSVKWMFAQRGTIRVNDEGLDKDALELVAIESGADDMEWNDKELTVYASLENMENVKEEFEKKNFIPESATVEWVAQNPVEITDAQRSKLENLFEALDEYDDVQEIYSNIK